VDILVCTKGLRIARWTAGRCARVLVCARHRAVRRRAVRYIMNYMWCSRDGWCCDLVLNAREVRKPCSCTVGDMSGCED